MKKDITNRILAVIPARGGSKSIPRKNILSFDGKPLIVYSIEMALKSKYIDEVVVSTDDEEIAEISEKYGAKAIKRPDEFARDDSPMIDALKHVLNNLKINLYLVVLLQPTSPLRNVETIDETIKIFDDNYDFYDSLVPLHPIGTKTGKITDGKYVPDYLPGIRRQDLELVYRECGTVFIFKPELIKKGQMFGKNIFPFLIKNYKEAIDIDTMDDFKKAEYFMGEKN